MAIVDACFSCKHVHGCLGDRSGSRPVLLSFRSSLLCTACYFQDMVWAGSVLEFLRSGASLATWQGGGPGLVYVGVKMGSGSIRLSPIPPLFHPVIATCLNHPFLLFLFRLVPRGSSHMRWPWSTCWIPMRRWSKLQARPMQLHGWRPILRP